tara:strand:+ start:3512 stop:3838 length:327 start_codon:yes stop_codon:yes gene_type:complete
MDWSDLSTPERYAIIGGGFTLAGAVGFGVWFTLQSRRFASFDYELSQQERDQFNRQVACNNDGIVRQAAAYSGIALKEAGYDVDDNQDEVVKRLYSHLGLQPPIYPCP